MNKAPILIAAAILGSFAVGGVGLVAMTHELTAERIAENQRQAMLAKLKAIVPAERIANDPLADSIQVSAPDLLGAEQTEVYRVRDTDEPVAVILQPVVPDGYAGPIRLLVSVLRDGSLGGVRVLEHHETPGLGDKIDEKKDDWIIEQFNGRSLGNPPLEDWQVKRDGGEFDQFTGATITPRSIVNAVKNTLLFVEREGDALYAPPEQAPAAPAGESAPAQARAMPGAAGTPGAG
ncbi:electron transport complex subunit RsxG [Thiohalocapsa sp.]|jgi:electron transport complex protein RnfG|uniref:electron transport complex subunit RsxG n=1 Tax=Thiohalocapsa sp. TaxID=2497641 RepID=UPI0025F9011A|nr:electron transport complex subunit RsxG [Thiohalocapsa sp.]